MTDTLDQSTMEMLEELKKERELKRAEEERNRQRQSRYDALKKDEAYAILKEGGIDEMIQKTPEILDTPAALQTAVQNATLKVQMKKMQEAQPKPQETPVQNVFTPGSQSATPPADIEPSEITNDEFFAKVSSGTATVADLEKAKGIEPYTRYQMKKILSRGIEHNKDIIAQGRAALGSD